MNITILTYGSRGDVQPLIPVSLGLMTRGHSVRLAAPFRFKNLVEEQGIQFVSLAGEPAELSQRLNDAGLNPIRMIRELMDHAIEVGADIARQTEEACQDADLIVHTFMHAIGAHTVACEKNIPDIHIQFFPMFTPTGDYPHVSFPDLKFRLLNRWTHKLSSRFAFWAAKAGYEQVRRRTGLPKRKLCSPFGAQKDRPPTSILCAWSPNVVPPSSDWLPNVHVTGYLFGDLDATYRPPDELQAFLDAGRAPVCVSFGSMLNRNAEKIDRIVRESLRQTGNRGIVLSGWSDIRNESSRDILCLEAVSHQWLLPHCKMIIHHGGAGTTSAGLRAGVPNIIVPFTADQPFWGSRVHSIGAGPKPIHAKELSVSNLSSAIHDAEDNDIGQHASDISKKLMNENGIGKSIEWIEKYSDEFLC